MRTLTKIRKVGSNQSINLIFDLEVSCSNSCVYCFNPIYLFSSKMIFLLLLYDKWLFRSLKYEYKMVGGIKLMHDLMPMQMLKSLVMMRRKVNMQNSGMNLASLSNLESLRMLLTETDWQNF